MSIPHLLQQAYVLATGTAASAATLAPFEAWVAEDGHFGRVADYFEAQLGALAAEQGVVATVRQLAFNGMGVVLSDAQAQAVTQSLLAQGIDSWAELLAFVIEANGGAFQVLDQRAEAAAAFNDALAAMGEPDLFAGDAVGEAVRELLQSVDGSGTSLADAIAQLEALAQDLAQDDEEPVPDTEAPGAPLSAHITIAGDQRIVASEAGGIQVSGTAGAVEGGATVIVAIDDDGNAATAPVTAQATAAANGSFRIAGLDVSGLDDGTLTITIVAKDAAGNASAPSTMSARMDTQAPNAVDTALVQVAGDGRINAAEAAGFTVEGGRDVAGANAPIRVSIDDEDAATAPATASLINGHDGFMLQGVDVSSLADGTLTFTFTTEDGMGNVSTPSALTAVKDTAAQPGPSLSGVTDDTSPQQGAVADGGSTNDSTPTVRVSLAGTEAAAGDSVRLHAGASAIGDPVTLTSTHIANGWVDITTPVLAESAHTLSASITDVAGNVGSQGAGYSIAVDLTAPSVDAVNISVTSTGGGAQGAYGAGDTVTIAFDPTGHADIAGVTVDFSAFGGAAAVAATLSEGVYSASYTIEAGGIDGGAKASVTATDTAGNAGTMQDDTEVAVDNVAPTVTVTSSQALLQPGQTATVTFTFSEDPGESFAAGDVTVHGGTIGQITGSGLTRTATFTAAASETLSTGATIGVAAGSYTDANGNGGEAGAGDIETVFNPVLFVGNSATFGRDDPVMSYNTYDAVTNPGGVHDLTSPDQGGNFANPTGTNNYEPHNWGGVPGLVDAFADQVGLSYDISMSTRNAATLRGHYLNTSPAAWDMRGNIASEVWDMVVLQDQTDEPLPGGSGSITFAPGSSTATLVITPTGDGVSEYDETFALSLLSGGASYSAASTSAVTTTILNDDPAVAAPNPALPTVTLTTSGSVMEDGTGNIVFTFTRTGPTTSDLLVTFSLTRDGSTSPSVATTAAGDFVIYSGSPYVFASGGAGGSTTGTMSFTNSVGTIVIKAGQTSATLTLDPKTDATAESAEGVQLGLKHANADSPIYNLGTQGIVSAAILNDDGINPSLPSVTMSVTSASAVYENAGDSIVYTFTRSGDTTNPLTVNFGETGTATYFASSPGSSDFSFTTTGTSAAALETTSGNNADIAAFEQYATLIEDYIHTGTPGGGIPDNPNASAETDVYLYATWARPDMIVGAWDMVTEKIAQPDGSWNGGTVTQTTTAATGYYLTLEDMSADLTAAYEHLADVNPDFEGVAPVSTAFMEAVQAGIAIRDPYTESAGEGRVNLWYQDNLHASKYGSYLAGLTLFSTLTGLDPRVLGAGDAVAGDLGIDAATAVALQIVASATLNFDQDFLYTAPGSVSDLGGTNESAILATAGAYTFNDGTYTSHTVSVTAAEGNLGTLQATVRSDGHAGQVNWIYTVNNNAVDSLLAPGQAHVDTFTIVLSDGHGHTTTEIVGVSVMGSD